RAVHRFVDLDLEGGKVPAHRGASLPTVLADAAGEADHIHPVQFQQEGAKITAYRSYIYVQRKPRAMTARSGCFVQIAHVAAGAADAGQARLAAQDARH